MENLKSLLKVQIDFDQSHLLFPAITHWLLLILFVIILATRVVPMLREVTAGKRSLAFAPGGFDAWRFFGVLALTVAYIVGMERVGALFPNRGYGFLLTSVAYVFALGLLFAHGTDRRKLIVIGLNAVLAPSIAWFVLARLFRITLP